MNSNNRDVCRRNIIIEAVSPEGLAAHHNFVLNTFTLFNKKEKRFELRVSSLSPFYEHGKPYKEMWSKDAWEKAGYESKYPDRVKNNLFIFYRSQYEISVFAEEDIFDGNFDDYLSEYNHFVREETELLDNYPVIGAFELNIGAYETEEERRIKDWQWATHNWGSGDLSDDPRYHMPAKEELEKFKNDEIEKTKTTIKENLKSWE